MVVVIVEGKAPITENVMILTVVVASSSPGRTSRRFALTPTPQESGH
jgi:hypothetical protein